MNEESFKPDFDLLDRYQQFSAELLRIALLGIALLGFFIEKVAGANYYSASSRSVLLILTALTSISCLVSAAGALAHRYFSTDGIFYHVRSLRRRAPVSGGVISSDSQTAPSGDAASVPPFKQNYYSLRVASDEGARNARYSKSGRCLGLSVGAMIAAAFFAVAAITVAAMSYVPESSIDTTRGTVSSSSNQPR
ncbi:hypothetical protein [Sorangium sp. So ce145]|uniref:hypothetical protein n=1 Tax=Sorangium sp. So ce145 TaxID=3133285 RepID=UPI003F629C38